MIRCNEKNSEKQIARMAKRKNKVVFLFFPVVNSTKNKVWRRYNEVL